MTLSKTDMRREAVSVRETMPLKGDEGELAAGKLLASVDLPLNGVVAVYLPLGRELDTAPLIDALRAQGLDLALPAIVNGVMTFRRWAGENDLVPGPYGILQPASGDIVAPSIAVCPLLAFDRKGTRLGRGGGHYDRTLAQLRNLGHNILAVGYGYAQQICLFPLPREDHDIRMDMVITPQDVHDFRA